MSRKDYVAVAAEIKSLIENHNPGTAPVPNLYLTGVVAATEAIAGVFASDNSNFDRARFLAACGIN